MTDSTELVQFLRNLGIGTAEPRWSSLLLRNVFQENTGQGQECVGLVLCEVFNLLRTSALNASVAALIRDLSVCAFTQYRASYALSDMSPIVKGVKEGCSPAQAYLGLYVIPPHMLDAEVVVGLLKSLALTEFFDEAILNLSDELKSSEVKLLLRCWINSDVSADTLERIRRHTDGPTL